MNTNLIFTTNGYDELFNEFNQNLISNTGTIQLNTNHEYYQINSSNLYNDLAYQYNLIITGLHPAISLPHNIEVIVTYDNITPVSNRAKPIKQFIKTMPKTPVAIYNSITHLAEVYTVNKNTLYSQLKQNNNRFNSYFFMDENAYNKWLLERQTIREKLDEQCRIWSKPLKNPNCE